MRRHGGSVVRAVHVGTRARAASRSAGTPRDHGASCEVEDSKGRSMVKDENSGMRHRPEGIGDASDARALTRQGPTRGASTTARRLRAGSMPERVAGRSGARRGSATVARRGRSHVDGAAGRRGASCSRSVSWRCSSVRSRSLHRAVGPEAAGGASAARPDPSGAVDRGRLGAAGLKWLWTRPLPDRRWWSLHRARRRLHRSLEGAERAVAEATAAQRLGRRAPVAVPTSPHRRHRRRPILGDRPAVERRGGRPRRRGDPGPRADPRRRGDPTSGVDVAHERERTGREVARRSRAPRDPSGSHWFSLLASLITSLGHRDGAPRPAAHGPRWRLCFCGVGLERWTEARGERCKGLRTWRPSHAPVSGARDRNRDARHQRLLPALLAVARALCGRPARTGRRCGNERARCGRRRRGTRAGHHRHGHVLQRGRRDRARDGVRRFSCRARRTSSRSASTCRFSRSAVATTQWKCVAAIAQWYGFPSIPIGSDKPDNGTDNNSPDIVGPCAQRAAASTPTPDSAVNVYRAALAAQPDHSVVMVGIGFEENFAALLDSPPDATSSLNGDRPGGRQGQGALPHGRGLPEPLRARPTSRATWALPRTVAEQLADQGRLRGLRGRRRHQRGPDRLDGAPEQLAGARRARGVRRQRRTESRRSTPPRCTTRSTRGTRCSARSAPGANTIDSQRRQHLHDGRRRATTTTSRSRPQARPRRRSRRCLTSCLPSVTQTITFTSTPPASPRSATPTT